MPWVELREVILIERHAAGAGNEAGGIEGDELLHGLTMLGNEERVNGFALFFCVLFSTTNPPPAPTK